jgi:glutathione S-transferase
VRAYCVNNSYSLADIAVGCALGYLDFRFAELAWRERFPALTRLADVLAQRASFAATVPVA